MREVAVVEAEWTFWDKILILHGQRSLFDRRGVLRGDGHRISRHYYDVHRLEQSGVAGRAVGDAQLRAHCVRHAQLFFRRPDYNLEGAARGDIIILPPGPMLEALRRDYTAMQGMIFGGGTIV